MIAWWWIPVGLVGLIVLVFLVMLVLMRHELQRYLRIESM
jgi:hypothetical protein